MMIHQHIPLPTRMFFCFEKGKKNSQMTENQFRKLCTWIYTRHELNHNLVLHMPTYIEWELVAFRRSNQQLRMSTKSNFANFPRVEWESGDQQAWTLRNITRLQSSKSTKSKVRQK